MHATPWEKNAAVLLRTTNVQARRLHHGFVIVRAYFPTQYSRLAVRKKTWPCATTGEAAV